MTPEQIAKLIDSKIRAHEIRVGIVSGVIGLVWLVANVWVFLAIASSRGC